ncbi:MAG: ATP F0F1 synthase subunit B [Pseudomonadota bacterium]
MALLYNTDIVVTIGFLIFVGILLYFGVPKIITGMLDARAEKIRADIEEARNLREEAQGILADYERKQKEVEELTSEIVTKAKADSEANKVQAMADLELAIERRLQAAKDQIASAEASAMKDVKDRAVSVAVSAAADVLAQKITADKAGSLIDSSIATVQSKLH